MLAQHRALQWLLSGIRARIFVGQPTDLVGQTATKTTDLPTRGAALKWRLANAQMQKIQKFSWQLRS
jgi:hypothetical protein